MAELVTIPEIDFVIVMGGGYKIPIGRDDANGIAINISARNINLQTETGLNVAAIVNPDDGNGKLIQLSEAQVTAANFPIDDGTKYRVVDTTSNPDEVLFYGRMVGKGWA